jgi:hypothetical protein
LPHVIESGEHDGLAYFPISIGDRDYWLTEWGLMDPEELTGVSDYRA